jgi:MFS family permease
MFEKELSKLNLSEKDFSNLKISAIEGCFASLMFGGGMVFITTFAIKALNASPMEIAFLSAFPAFLGAIAQLFSCKAIEIFGNRKKAVIALIAIQALCWLPIALIALRPEGMSLPLIALYTFSITVGGMGGPLWQGWMKSVVPKNVFNSYFGIRGSIAGFVSLATTILSGFALFYFGLDFQLMLLIFFAVFFVSFIGRIFSMIYFTKMTDTNSGIEIEETNFNKFVFSPENKNFKNFLIYMSLLTFFMAAVGPFYQMNLLRDLKVDYFVFTLIITASTFSGLISMPFWGKIIDRYGTTKVLKGAAFFPTLFPLAYILIRDPWMLIVLEFVAGVNYGGFNLAIANFIYENAPEKKIMKFAGYQAAILGVASFMGLLIGGVIVSMPFSFGIISNSFYLLCLVSAIFRIILYFGLMPKIHSSTTEHKIESHQIALMGLTMEPIRDAFFSQALFIFTSGKKVIAKIKEQGRISFFRGDKL